MDEICWVGSEGLLLEKQLWESRQIAQRIFSPPCTCLQITDCFELVILITIIITTVVIITIILIITILITTSSSPWLDNSALLPSTLSTAPALLPTSTSNFISWEPSPQPSPHRCPAMPWAGSNETKSLSAVISVIYCQDCERGEKKCYWGRGREGRPSFFLLTPLAAFGYRILLNGSLHAAFIFKPLIAFEVTSLYMSNISQEAVFFRPFDVRLLPLTPLRAKKWEAFSSQGDFIFFPCDTAAGSLSGSGMGMVLPWGRGPEVTDGGHCFEAKLPELSPS